MTTHHPELKVGGMIYFRGDKRGFRITGRNDRYLVGWKTYPGNYLYTIVDFEEKRRGPDNLVFSCHTYNTERGARAAIVDLRKGDMEVSHRHGRKLDLCTKEDRGNRYAKDYQP